MTEQPLTTIASPAPYYIAKSNVCVNSKGESIGNGLFATSNFNAGEEVAAFERPLVGSLDAERLQDTCANCYVWVEGSSTGTRLYVPEDTRLQKCAGCQRFRYCSKACQKAAWNRGHKLECKILKPMASREIPKAVLACMELLSRRKHGLIADEAWASLCRLPSHIEDFKHNGTYGNIELMAMGASQFSLTQRMFDRDFVAAMYARVLTNSLTLITPSLDPLGIILDSDLCSINHSCEPNAYMIMDGPSVRIRTLRAIKKDEEVYISYIDTTNPFHRRQSELKTRWFFSCKCEKCRKEVDCEEDVLAIRPKKNSTQPNEAADIPSEGDTVTQNLSIDVRNTPDAAQAALLEEKAFAEYEAQQRTGTAEEAIEIIHGTMRLCRESGLWPLHRQPYAILRDDLIVNLLSIGDFQSAWMHCIKRYKHITPILYPVPFHPVRVVQSWQMAMLAAYLASAEDSETIPGLNMGLIAMMLVKQVSDASILSHGSDNAFTKSVARKADEMMEELKRTIGSPDIDVMNKELEAQRDLLMQMADWEES